MTDLKINLKSWHQVAADWPAAGGEKFKILDQARAAAFKQWVLEQYGIERYRLICYPMQVHLTFRTETQALLFRLKY